MAVSNCIKKDPPRGCEASGAALPDPATAGAQPISSGEAIGPATGCRIAAPSNHQKDRSAGLVTVMSASNSRTLGLESSDQGKEVGLWTLRRSDSQCGEPPLRSGTPVHRDVAGIPYSGTSTYGPVNLRIGAAMHDCRKEDRARGRLPSRRAAFCIVLAVGALSAALPLNALEQCRLCHPDEVTAYLRTGMGRVPCPSDSGQPSGMYYHGYSGTTSHVELSDRGMVHRIQREGLEASYVIGSGNAAFGYLIPANDAIIQSPIAYYSDLQTWGMAPGMERYSEPDFTRPASAECLWCDSGQPRPVPGSVNRYESPPFVPRSFRATAATARRMRTSNHPWPRSYSTRPRRPLANATAFASSATSQAWPGSNTPVRHSVPSSRAVRWKNSGLYSWAVPMTQRGRAGSRL